MELNQVKSMANEIDEKERHSDSYVSPGMELLSTIMSSIAEEEGILSTSLVMFTATDFSSTEGVDKLINFLGSTMSKEKAGQWAVCFFRNSLPFCNITETVRRTARFYYNLRLPELGEGDDAKKQSDEELRIILNKFFKSDQDTDFYKKAE